MEGQPVKFSSPLEEVIHATLSDIGHWEGDDQEYGLTFGCISIDHSKMHHGIIKDIAADHDIDLPDDITSFEGHYLITENSDGIVNITRYDHRPERDAVFAELRTAYDKFRGDLEACE